MNTGSTYYGQISITVDKTGGTMLLIANQPQNSHPIPNRMLNEQKQPTGFKYNMCRFHKQLELEDKADIDGNSALLGDHLLLLAPFALMGRDVISGPSGSEVREKGLAYKKTWHSMCHFIWGTQTTSVTQHPNRVPFQQAYQDSEQKPEVAAREDWPH